LQRPVGTAFPGPGRKSLTKAEREQPKGNLRARIAGRDSGIELNTNFRWVFSGIKRPALFFEHLALWLASDAVLYFEGCSLLAMFPRFMNVESGRFAGVRIGI
jgi:hypothetical protein